MTGTAHSQAFLGFEPYVAAEEAAEFLKITPRRIKEMARAGSIPAHPVDPDAERKEWRFLLSELSVWMRANSGTKRLAVAGRISNREAVYWVRLGGIRGCRNWRKHGRHEVSRRQFEAIQDETRAGLEAEVFCLSGTRWQMVRADSSSCGGSF